MEKISPRKNQLLPDLQNLESLARQLGWEKASNKAAATGSNANQPNYTLKQDQHRSFWLTSRDTGMSCMVGDATQPCRLAYSSSGFYEVVSQMNGNRVKADALMQQPNLLHGGQLTYT